MVTFEPQGKIDGITLLSSVTIGYHSSLTNNTPNAKEHINWTKLYIYFSIETDRTIILMT